MPSDALETKVLDTARGPLAAIEGGSGDPALLFVHGNAGRKELWEPVLERLAPRRRVLALDLHGFGASPQGERALSLDAFAEDLVALAETAGLGDTVLVAHSMGAAVAVRAARQSASLARGLFFVDGGTDLSRIPKADRDALWEALSGKGSAAASFTWMLRLLGGASEATKERVLAAQQGTPRKSFLAGVEMLLDHDAAGELSQVQLPAHHLYSRELNDRPHSLHRLVSSLVAEPIDGTSHWPMLDAPDAVATSIERFAAAL